MVLTRVTGTALLASATLALAACLGTAPPRRLAEPTPIALVVHLESAGGEEREVPAAVGDALSRTLAARNLEVVAGPRAALAERRASDQRLEALIAATDAPWVMLVEARARFFSQISGRYRWEVELRTSLVSRARATSPQVSDLAVAAFLLFEHEAEPEALAFVRRQLVDDVGALVDRVVIGEGAAHER